MTKILNNNKYANTLISSLSGNVYLNYLTVINAQNIYQPINLMTNYLTVINAQNTYQPISLMTNYLTLANAGYYLLKSDAAIIYI